MPAPSCHAIHLYRQTPCSSHALPLRRDDCFKTLPDASKIGRRSMPIPRPASTTDVRKHNQSRVLRMICASDYVSLQEIAARLDLSVPTVLTAVRNLQQDGLVREAGEFASTGGRKAKAFSLVPESRHSIGVEITSNYVEFEPLIDNTDSDRRPRKSRDLRVCRRAGSPLWRNVLPRAGFSIRTACWVWDFPSRGLFPQINAR